MNRKEKDMDKLQAQEYLTQGNILLGQGKYDEALSYYKKAENEDPMNLDIYISKGITYANQEQLNRAKEQFEKALKINRRSGVTYFHLGSIELLEGNTSAGIENYNMAIANGYDDAQLYYNLGLLYEEYGDSDLAIRNYSKAIQRDALRPDIRIRKARLLIRLNHFNEALQALDETILTNPDVFEGYHIKFMLLIQMNRLDDAEKLLDTALYLFPEDHGFDLDRVTLKIEQKRTEEALEILTNLEKVSAMDDELLRRVFMQEAQIYASIDNIEQAISSLEQAKKISEKNNVFDTEVVFLLASCHLAQGKYQELLLDARQILEKGEDGYNKETARYYEPLALKMLGKKNEAEIKYTEALTEFRRKSLEIPGNLDSYLLRALCFRDMEQYDKALELINYVVQLQPERVEPLMLKVALLEALGKTEEAANVSEVLEGMIPNELKG